jgi:hypothetical protein
MQNNFKETILHQYIKNKNKNKKSDDEEIKFNF